ncbi:MAG: hypothetical protein J3R72DRAFT_87242 [Linnemannia gamsii]|nr:MAG: hypothetical protein J3R72DRAFT_87242 [Linnemannia gamsii]
MTRRFVQPCAMSLFFCFLFCNGTKAICFSCCLQKKSPTILPNSMPNRFTIPSDFPWTSTGTVYAPSKWYAILAYAPLTVAKPIDNAIRIHVEPSIDCS